MTSLLTVVLDRQGVERDYIEDSDASPLPDFNFFLATDAEQWSSEIRLDGETEKVRWVAGFYYLSIDIADANGAEIPLLGVDPSGAATAPDGMGNYTGRLDSPYIGIDNQEAKIHGPCSGRLSTNSATSLP